MHLLRGFSFNMNMNSHFDYSFMTSTSSIQRQLENEAYDETQQFFYTCAISLSFFLLIWLIFEALRNNKAIFMTRLTPTYIQSGRVPSRPGFYPGAWIPAIYSYSDEDVLRMNGLDGYMLLRFTGTCFRAAFIMSLLGAALLLPLYATGDEKYDYWNKYTLANISRDEYKSRLWAPVVFCYIFAAVFCAQLYFEYENFVHKRMQFLMHGDPDTPAHAYYTVCVERLPQRLGSKQALTEYFEKLFPGQVFSVEPVFQFRPLHSLHARRLTLCRSLELAVARCWSSKERPTIRITQRDLNKLPSNFPLQQKTTESSVAEVDEINYYSVKLGILNEEIRALQSVIFDAGDEDDTRGSGEILPQQTEVDTGGRRESSTTDGRGSMESSSERRSTPKVAAVAVVRGVREAGRAGRFLTLGAASSPEYATCAFVTFKSRVSKSAAKQMLLSNRHFRMQVKSAPRPDDYIWKNVPLPVKQVDLRRRVISFLGLLVLILFGAFCAIIIAIFNLSEIAKTYPPISAYSHTLVYTVLNNYLAIGALLLVVSLLPLLITIIAIDYEKRKQKSDVQNAIMDRYFLFQMVYVYVSVIGGSFLFNINELIEEPDRILQILGETIPTFSIYFANVVIMKSFVTVPLQMIRILPLIRTLIATVFSKRSNAIIRDLRAGAFMNPPSLYGWSYPNVLLVLMIMCIYAFISPFILPFCALFFGMAYTVYKYQLLYVFIDEYQSGGGMWYAVFRNSMVALMGGIVVMLVYFAIRIEYASSPFYGLLPLPFLISFFWKYCNETFIPPCLNLSLEKALEIDEMNKKKEKETGKSHYENFNPVLFRQPELNQEPQKPNIYREGRPFLPPEVEPQEVATFKAGGDSDDIEQQRGSVVFRVFTDQDVIDPVVGDYSGLTLEVNAFLEGEGLVANPIYSSISADQQEAMRREEGYSGPVDNLPQEHEEKHSVYGTL